MGFIIYWQKYSCILPQEVLNKLKDKSITYKMFKIQDNESFMCRFYSMAFIEYMLAGKTIRLY